ncbi:hypothetical protein ACFL27_11885 [candidate division CSSED10-310 bacterium]|uniref:PD-(D/E)XK endonuclease-like domain-containing protein n=1 Tax=candidate division CSSED10-310 bacterium TaxID=2855610 RepID=A0ABV6YXG6_UNCC1
MEVIEKSKELLENNEKAWVDNYTQHAQLAIEAIQKIEYRRRNFRNWGKLRAYMSISRINDEKTPFSLRFKGQEVADIIVDDNDDDVFVKISGKKSEELQEYFSVKIPAGRYPWRGPVGDKLRSMYNKRKLQSAESSFHADVLDEMVKDTKSDKFCNTFSNIRPAVPKIGKKDLNIRIQFPVPLKAHDGVPELRKHGNLDILARIGNGGGTRLGVIELKSEVPKGKSMESTICQSLIYATCVRYLVRNKKMGSNWYKLYGFNGKIRKNLRIHSIIMFPDEFDIGWDIYCNALKNLGCSTNNRLIPIEGEDEIELGYMTLRKRFSVIRYN